MRILRRLNPIAFATVLALVTAGRGAAQSCDSTMRQPDVRQVTAIFDRLAAVGPVWDDFNMANHPVVLVAQERDTTRGACATIWRYRREAVVVALPRRIPFMTPLYGMWDGDPLGRDPVPGNSELAANMTKIPRSLEDALRAGGDSRAILLLAPLRFEDLGAVGRALAAMHIDPNLVRAQLVVHEGYHLHSQIPTWFDQPHPYAWPRWDRQPSRSELVARCYGGTPAVTDALKRETTALLEASDLLNGTRTPGRDSLARESARSFVQLRHARYALVDSIRISSPGGSVSCERAENMMELEEGAPQWMAYETAVRAGVMNIESAGRSSTENFYTTGAFQLWIMERFMGADEFRAVTARVTRAESAGAPTGSIFAVFSSFVGVR